MIDQRETFYSLLLNMLPSVGPVRIHQLLNAFKNLSNAFENGIESWASIEGFTQELIETLPKDVENIKRSLDEELLAIEKEKIQVLTFQSEIYPPLLRAIQCPPPVLYVKGEEIHHEVPVVAIVGSRRASYYGERVSKMIAGDLGKFGIVTVSGLARGIDRYVHESTIDSGGKTWAVIGSGLHSIYPPDNRNLAKRIEKSGAMISEFSLKTHPFPANFPRRNRIIAGLSYMTVLVEGGEKSGSLITARLAVEEGREVLAVPGPITSPLSVAPHRFLQMGAHLYQTGEDVISLLPEKFKKNWSVKDEAIELNSSQDISKEFKLVLGILSHDPISKEVVAEKLNWLPAVLSTLLFQMELKGLIKVLPGGLLVKK